MANGQRYCIKCRKTMSENNFYKLKSGERSDMCKACETMHINNWESDTFLWLLEKYDVPWIPAEWNVLRDRAYQKDPYKMTGMSVFGKYISKMKLKQWGNYTYADSERLQLEAEEKRKLYGSAADISQEKLQEMKEAYEQGIISEAQYLTYAETQAPSGVIDEPAGSASPPQPQGSPQVTSGNGNNFYPVNDNPFEQVELVNIGADLTDDDKIYLAMKWGRLYSAADWVYLEQKYNDFMDSFDIQGAARIDSLIQICKLSLKLNQALDTGDMETYAKLVRSYDLLSKSAKFTEAQKKEDNSQEFSGYGQIVSFCEEKTGFIPRLETHTERDIADKDLSDMKKWVRELVEQDPAIYKQIEQYIKKREIASEQAADATAALENGDEEYVLSDEDMKNYNDSLEEQKRLDFSLVDGEEDEE